MNTATITLSLDGATQSIPITTTVTMPFGNSFWGTPLPANATIDGVNGPAAITELKRQAALAKPMLNVDTWTAEHIIVPAGQPLIPVTCSSGDAHLNSMFAAGVPIPPGTTPTNDSDSALTIWQPSATGGGTYWEMQAAHKNPTTGAWSCSFGGKVTNANGTPNGHYVQYVTGPSGTYQSSSWGTQGSGLPYWPGVLSLLDCARGRVDHALLLEVYDARSGGHVWPASRSDGAAGSTNPAYALQEGMRLRLPPGYSTPAGLHPICQLEVQAASKFGIVVTDRTLSGLGMRATPSVRAGGYVGSTADFDVLDGFPWGDLQLLAVGSDTNQTPTS